MVRAVGAVMGESGAEALYEQPVAGQSALRTDVNAHFMGRAGHPATTLRVDVAVTSPTSTTSLAAGAARRAGTACRSRERRKVAKYATLCAPDDFYGAIVEPGGRLSLGFTQLLLVLATHYVQAAAGHDELSAIAQRAATAVRLESTYATISIGVQRACVGALQRTAARVRAMEFCPGAGARRSRTVFRGRAATRSALFSQILPPRTQWHSYLIPTVRAR
jgi:hypothetical protein